MEDRRKKLLGKLSKLVKTQAQLGLPDIYPLPRPSFPDIFPEPDRLPCFWGNTPYSICQRVFPDVLPFGCPKGTAPQDNNRRVSSGCTDANGNPVIQSNCGFRRAKECNRFNCEVCDSEGKVIPDCKTIPCFDGPGKWDNPPLPTVPPDSPFAIDPPVPGGPAVPTTACFCALVKKNADGSYMISDDDFRKRYCGIFGSRKPCEYVTDENGRPILDENGRAKYVDPNCIPTFCPHIKNTQNDNPIDHGHISCSDVGSGTDRDPLTIPGAPPEFKYCIKAYCEMFPNCSPPIRLPNTPPSVVPPSRWRGWTTLTLRNPCLDEIMQRINTVCADITNVKPDDNPLIDSQPEKDPSDRITIEDQVP